MASHAPLSSLIHSTGSLGQLNRSSTALLTPALNHLADPPSQHHRVDQQLTQFLTHETIKLLLSSVRAARLRRQSAALAIEEELSSLGLLPPDEASQSVGGRKGKKPPPAGGSGEEDEGEKRRQEREEQDEDDEEVRKRLEEMGFKVGWATAERLAKDRPLFPPSPNPPAPQPSAPSSSSLPPPPPPDPLDLIKFLCKDVWLSLYDKQIDNLRTNHRGVWVLLDGNWRPLRGLSRGGHAVGSEGEREERRWVSFLLAFPCGLIRGCLANLGMHNLIVTGESPGGMQASFQIKTAPPSSTTPVPPAQGSPAVGGAGGR